jgi:hypothetical protein
MSSDSVYRDYKVPANILSFTYFSTAKSNKQAGEEPSNGIERKNSLKEPKEPNKAIDPTDKQIYDGEMRDGQVYDINPNPLQLVGQYSTNISMESRRKIDEIKIKLDALNKKYSAEAGLSSSCLPYQRLFGNLFKCFEETALRTTFQPSPRNTKNEQRFAEKSPNRLQTSVEKFTSASKIYDPFGNSIDLSLRFDSFLL